MFSDQDVSAVSHSLMRCHKSDNNKSFDAPICIYKRAIMKLVLPFLFCFILLAAPFTSAEYDHTQANHNSRRIDVSAFVNHDLCKYFRSQIKLIFNTFYRIALQPWHHLRKGGARSSSR